ncbi:MAG TPA: hypothetical protein DDX39_07740 [Bacteroidales bacterium]|nr:MAG: hypothetical protein A2W98_14375 [Bacteroidetes bacterium GWF2_33_38]OFY73164.1 MAG: hypothetical protein A2265_06030 [Bacteroidetes bacterium RIFOXYA12_FULL_33_9]OFY85012.1 MAG: hypothetical protein A2236_10085 [Bacteroidetes bacterium RIFOXYA2_FULL_33_7]HBF88517.1 hypothetical protein [Bacteroidales bacterium]
MDINIESRKLNLIRWITGLRDEVTLSQLEVFVKENSSNNILELSEEMKKAVDEALDSLDAGKGISHKQVMKNAQSKYPNLKFA